MWKEYMGGEEQSPESIPEFEAFVKKFAAIGSEWVLVKGGHCPFTRDGRAAKVEDEKEIVVDILYGHGTMIKFESPYQNSRHTHGTGCSLACKSTPLRGRGISGYLKADCGSIQLRLHAT
jgi:hydroxymethylpyrimidine/phosphomethylpyrimidine kinase